MGGEAVRDIPVTMEPEGGTGKPSWEYPAHAKGSPYINLFVAQ